MKINLKKCDFSVISESVDLRENGLRYDDSDVDTDVLDVNGQDARTAGPVSSVFLQSSVHLLEGDTRSWNRRL